MTIFQRVNRFTQNHGVGIVRFCRSNTGAVFDPFKGSMYSNPIEGLVIERIGDRLLVESISTGCVVECRQRKSLDVHNIVAGDIVHFQSIASDNEKEFIAVGYNTRRNILFRTDPKQPRKVKYIASNIDQLLIVVAVEPSVSLMSIDQLLVAAEVHNMKSSIVVNKYDLKGSAQYYDSLKFYETLGYNLIRCFVDLSIYESRNNEPSLLDGTSSTRNQDIGTKALRSVLCGKTSLLIGQSGELVE